MEEFCERVLRISADRLDQPTNGDLRRWVAALAELPSRDRCHLELDAVPTVVGDSEQSDERLRELLMTFHPWRKGPLQFLDHYIDTEWRSDWKWERVKDFVDLDRKTVLDIGCGNGYFGWRMLESGADFVLGLDPILRFVMQFEVFRRYVKATQNHFVVPLIDTDLPEKLSAFDVVFSMGVLYHRTSPIDHLRSLAGALRVGGQVVLETLIVEDDAASVLVPQDRYAQMRNVWFLPSVSMLRRWLERTGFTDVKTIDITTTTPDEQRSTDWMTFQSLVNFLDPSDHGKTIEGYPAPVRATLIATKER